MRVQFEKQMGGTMMKKICDNDGGVTFDADIGSGKCRHGFHF